MTLGNLYLLFFLVISTQALDYHDKSFLALSKSSNTFLQHTRLGRIILSFSSLAAKDSEFTPLYEALDLLLASLQEQITSENKLFGESYTVHNSSLETLSSQIESTQLEINNAKDLLVNSLQKTQTTLEEEIETIAQSLLDFKDRKDELQQQRADQQEENSQKILDLTEAINAIDDAIAILRTLSTNSEGTSFIQTRYENVNQVKSLLKLSVSRVKHSFYIETLVQALTSLGEKNFVDQDTLLRVLNLLKELLDSFETEKKNVADYDDQAQLLYENQLQSIEDSISAAETSYELANTNLDDINGNFILKG